MLVRGSEGMPGTANFGYVEKFTYYNVKRRVLCQTDP